MSLVIDAPPAPQRHAAAAARSLAVAIVGATGAVGAELIDQLERRGFPVRSLRLLASPRSAGRSLAFRGKPVTVEWFQAMNHASHLAGKPATCESCHGDKRTGAPRPRDHRACSICHARQAPVMTDCAACHTGTRSSPPPSAWSVAATFAHTGHAVDPRSRKPTACTECHKQIAGAKDMASVAPPMNSAPLTMW